MQSCLRSITKREFAVLRVFQLGCHTRRPNRFFCTAVSQPLAEPEGFQEVETRLQWPDAARPLEQAATLPAAFYTTDKAHTIERQTVFRRSWQVVGRREQAEQAGQYFTGHVAGCPFVVVRTGDRLQAFHNVCRHHAAPVAEGEGRAQCFQCQYHGWVYGLDGRLQKAVKIGGIHNFRAKDNGLVPMQLDTWGPFIFLHPTAPLARPAQPVADWLGGAAPVMEAAGMADARLQHVRSRSYELACNWKVFSDNYLDGGYHVAIAHPDLADGIDMASYAHSIYERVSIQTARTRPGSSSNTGDDRLGSQEVSYAFVYPNLMINRYGPWMDTNVVVPLAPDRCRVDFDWWIDQDLALDAGIIDAGVQSSDQVQQEDIKLCEGVQRGLDSPAYNVGRYVPKFEAPMFHFHRLLHAAMNNTDR